MHGEPLDIEQPDQLLAYLRQIGRLGPDERPRLTNLGGGVSNRTVLVQRDSGVAWVLKQALGRLRVQADWFSSPLRAHREAEALRWLHRLAPPGTVPALIFEDETVHLLAMAAVPQPHENWKQMLLAGRLHVDHVTQFARLLAAIHVRAAGRGDVAAALDDCSFFESLRLEPYYLYTAEQDPPAAAFLRTLVEQTRRNRFTLVHGEFSPKNILVHDGRLVLLDHEVAHYGDAAFDVGFSMTHLLSKANHLADRRADFVDAARLYWDRYAAETNFAGLEPRAIAHTLGCLLARVDGRSPLEYLLPDARQRPRRAALALMADPPERMGDLISRFVESL